LFVIRTVGCAAMALAVCSLAQAQADKKAEGTELRIAVFDLDAREGFGIDAKALTDQVTTILSSIGNVRLIERAELSKVAEEQKIGLSGLSDANALKLGKFVNAQYLVVGRGSKIGQTNYVVLKIIDVETTVQTTVATKAAVADGTDKLLERLEGSL